MGDSVKVLQMFMSILELDIHGVTRAKRGHGNE